MAAWHERTITGGCHSRATPNALSRSFVESSASGFGRSASHNRDVSDSPNSRVRNQRAE